MIMAPIQKMSVYVRFALLLALCFAYSLFRGRADHRTLAPKRVCVVQLAKLGDMVCTTPMFRALKQAYGNAEVFVVGNTPNKELLADNPHIDGYIVWNKNPFSMAQLLRRHHFDFLCVTTPNADALGAAYLAGIPLIAVPKVEGGYSPHETVSYRLLRKLVTTRPHTMGAYAPREYLRLLEPLGISTDDTAKTLGFSKEAERKAEEYFTRLAQGVEKGERKVIIGISPSSGNKIKAWPSERFAAVADHLVRKYDAEVIVFGGARDEEEVGKMMACIEEQKHVHNALNVFSIDELKAAIKRLTLFVSVDTGLVYIAEAFNVPTVDIVGPMDEREQPPRGPRHKVVTAPRRGVPQLHIMNARVYDAREARRQAEDIPVSAVIAAADEILGVPATL